MHEIPKSDSLSEAVRINPPATSKTAETTQQIPIVGVSNSLTGSEGLHNTRQSKSSSEYRSGLSYVSCIRSKRSQAGERPVLTEDKIKINAMPTKSFFVEMLVRDIPLERAVLDLIDNCIDGAKRLKPEEPPQYVGLKISIHMDEDRFEISDNCGGFDIETARNYAFRFGRPAQARSNAFSIGQFGVGMKRALFKFGRYFEIHSTTENQHWSMHVDVEKWEQDEDSWVFDFKEVIEDKVFPKEERGTRILVNRLRPEVASNFSNTFFQRRLAELIRSHQRQFIASGLAVEFIDEHLTNTDLNIYSGGQFNPAIEEVTIDEKTEAPMRVRIIVGVAESSPPNAGWYVVCNNRVILSADQSEATGWNTVAEQEYGIPKYHNQYARFRGVVFFNCRDSKKLPWNTTKTGLDTSTSIWQIVYQKMLDHTRTVIDFLNTLDDEIEEYGSSSSSPLLSAFNRQTSAKDVEKFHGSKAFSWDRAPRKPGPKIVKIQYSKEQTKIQALMTALSVNSAKAVGEATFDLIYREQCEDEE